MSQTDKLKEMIAGTLGVDKSDITDDFSLKVKKFKTSAGSVILKNMVKKAFGRNVDCRNAATFGELLARINGEEPADANVSGTSDETDKGADETDKMPDDVKSSVTDPSEDMEAPVQRGRVTSFRPVCGIDIQEISIFPETDDYWSESFYTDNYTPDEIAYCITAPQPRHSFAARWCLKEALHKCGEDYYDIPLKDIRAVRLKTGELRVEIRDESGSFKRLPFACSVSHADNYAVGMVTGYV